ncbi:MAG: hypothetical protein V3T39_04860 [Gammaproteobacteria bacterium]
MMKHRFAITAVLPCIMCGGCGLLTSDEPPVEVIWLRSPSVELEQDTIPQGSLKVSLQAVPGLDTDTVLILDEDARMRRHASLRWQEHLPELFETLVSHALESTRLYEQVMTERALESANRTLMLELREFYIVTSDSSDPVVHIQLAGQLYCEDDKHSIKAGSNQTVTGDGDIAQAFQRAVNETLQELARNVQPSEQHCRAAANEQDE